MCWGRNRAADGADAAANECSGANIAVRRTRDSGARTCSKQSTRYGTRARIVTTSG